MRCHGHYKESLILINQATSEFELVKVKPRFDLLLEKGLSLALAGDLQSAENLIGKALEIAKESNHALAVAHLAETLGHFYYQQGRHAQALKLTRKRSNFHQTTLCQTITFRTPSHIFTETGEN